MWLLTIETVKTCHVSWDFRRMEQRDATVAATHILDFVYKNTRYGDTEGSKRFRGDFEQMSGDAKCTANRWHRFSKLLYGKWEEESSLEPQVSKLVLERYHRIVASCEMLTKWRCEEKSIKCGYVGRRQLGNILVDKSAIWYGAQASRERVQEEKQFHKRKWRHMVGESRLNLRSKANELKIMSVYERPSIGR